jgi:hypothetical protein
MEMQQLDKSGLGKVVLGALQRKFEAYLEVGWLTIDALCHYFPQTSRSFFELFVSLECVNNTPSNSHDRCADPAAIMASACRLR